MKFTNRTNLPDAIIQAIKNDDYTKGKSDISITGLISPARKRVLLKKFDEQIECDYADKINILMGQVMHGILERANKAALAEERFYLDLEGITISGEMDAVYEDSGLLQDYKLTSLYQVKDGKVSEEYEAQLNCYAYLLKYGYRLKDEQRIQVNYKINKMQDVFLLKDWSKPKALRDPKIPKYQCVIIDVPMWGDDKTLQYIVSRINAHKAANKKLPDCTLEERWAEPDKWAVMKPGAKKSIKNHEDKAEAELHAVKVGAEVQFRPGSSSRCEGGYCDAASVCEQFKKLKSLKLKSQVSEDE
jgi:hypothetical protein